MSTERDTNAVLAKTMQTEREEATELVITLTLNEEQEEKLNCIIASQEEATDPQGIIQRLFDETLTANYLYNSKCGGVEIEEDYTKLFTQ